jgi:hypothetical protein
MKRFLSVVVSFAVVALCGNAVNIERVFRRTTPSIAVSVTEEVLSVARQAGEATGLDRVRETGEDIRSLLSGVQYRAESGESFLLCGDSMMETIAPVLAARLGTKDIQSSTFISRGSAAGSALWSWEDDVAREVRRTKADVVVIMLDAEAREQSLYAEEVASVVEAAIQAGAKSVVWLERPITLDEAYEAQRAMRHSALRDARDKQPEMVIVDATRSVMPSTGAVGSYITTAKGERVRVRTADGVHLTVSGAELFAEEVLQQLGL